MKRPEIKKYEDKQTPSVKNVTQRRDYTVRVNFKKETTTEDVIEEKRVENKEKPVITETAVEVTAEKSKAAAPDEAKKARKEQKKSEKANRPSGIKRIISFYKTDEKRSVRSVGSRGAKRHVPVFSIVFSLFLATLMMFIIIDYVQIFENQRLITDLRENIEECKSEEKRITSLIETKYDLMEIALEATENYGMSGEANQKKVYIDISEEDSIEGYEPENKDYGAIATIMNALGDSARALAGAFGG